MSARSEARTAAVCPTYGMRSVGGWGVRGWRAHCADCGFLSRLFTNIRGAQYRAYSHRCEPGGAR